MCCLECGCHSPSDDHNDPRHITLQQVRDAAEASGISTTEAASRIADEVKRAIAERMLGASSESKSKPQ